jgi:uncharacterized DUF497 family protein
MQFIWDESKNRSNIKKHGINFNDACYAFADPNQLNMPDHAGNYGEDRWLLLGAEAVNGTIVVVHVEVEQDTMRIISARPATKHEKKLYLERKIK